MLSFSNVHLLLGIMNESVTSTCRVTEISVFDLGFFILQTLFMEQITFMNQWIPIIV
jgi:hypothetical protein